MPTYIYVLHCPLTDRIRYIGKTISPRRRLAAHISAARRNVAKHHTAAWIRQVLAADQTPVMQVIDEIKEGESWQEIERFWISQADEMGWDLTNSTAGGEGSYFLFPIADAAYRAKLSATHKKIWNTPERKEEARLRALTAWADPEVVARRKATMDATKVKPETIARYRAAALEIARRPEVQAKKGASLKAAWADPVRKAAWIEATTTPEVKAKQSASKLALWASEEGRQKMLDSHTPERRARQAELLADPARKAKIDAARNSQEYKAKRAATIRAKLIEKNKHLSPADLEKLLALNDYKNARRKAAKLATQDA